MLDHLQWDHLGQADQDDGASVAPGEAAARSVGRGTSATQPAQRPRTPAIAIAAIGLMVLTAAGVLLPGEVPAGALVFVHLVLVAYGMTLLARRHPEVLGGSPRDATPQRGGEARP
jgi:hypothetical protein